MIAFTFIFPTDEGDVSVKGTLKTNEKTNVKTSNYSVPECSYKEQINIALNYIFQGIFRGDEDLLEKINDNKPIYFNNEVYKL